MSRILSTASTSDRSARRHRKTKSWLQALDSEPTLRRCKLLGGRMGHTRCNIRRGLSVLFLQAHAAPIASAAYSSY